MIRTLCALLMVLGLAAEDRVWVGLYVLENGEDGKPSQFYVMGRIGAETLEAVQSGRQTEGFVRLTETCWQEEDPQRIVANAAAEDNREQTDVVLYRVARIERIALLKGDPRLVIPAKPGAAAKPPAVEGY